MKANKAFERVCNLISEKYLDNGWKYSKICWSLDE